jgi:SAM-dependent methyltransferase
MTDHRQYSNYLTNRSWIGYLYRRLILYPRLCKYLKFKTLDVGCGIGDMLQFRPNTIGVDVNPFNVEICNDRGLPAQVMDVDQLPFTEGSFNSVLLDNVLEHIEFPDVLLREIHRVLVDGGLLVIGVPGMKGQNSDPDHVVYYDETALMNLAANNNFVIKKFFYMPLFKSQWLSIKVRQYCIYSVWVKYKN